MVNHLLPVIILGLVLLTVLTIIIIIKWRYHTFSTGHVLFFRQGKLFSNHIGGSYFLLPFIDQLVVINSGIQRADFKAEQQIVFKPNFEGEELNKKIDWVKISGFILYKVHTPLKFLGSGRNEEISIPTVFNAQTMIDSTTEDISDIVESSLKSLVLEVAMDKLYQNRIDLVNHIRNLINPVIAARGLELIDIRIQSISFE